MLDENVTFANQYATMMHKKRYEATLQQTAVDRQRNSKSIQIYVCIVQSYLSTLNLQKTYEVPYIILPPGQAKKLPFIFEQQQVPPKTISGRFYHKTCCTTSANKQTICWRMQSFGRSIKHLNQNVKFDPTLISRVAVTKYPVEDLLWRGLEELRQRRTVH